MNQRMDGLTKNCLKRISFIHQSRRHIRKHQSNQLPKTFQFCPTDFPQPWNDEQVNLQISISAPQVTSLDSQNDMVKRSLTMAMINEDSQKNAVTNGGIGVFIKFPAGSISTALAFQRYIVIKTAISTRRVRRYYHLFSRLERVTLMSLLTSHNRMDANMFNMFKLAPSPTRR